MVHQAERFDINMIKRALHGNKNIQKKQFNSAYLTSYSTNDCPLPLIKVHVL